MSSLITICVTFLTLQNVSVSPSGLTETIPRFAEEPPRPIPRLTEEPPRPIPRFAEEPPRYLPRFAEEPPQPIPRLTEEPPRPIPRFAEEPPRPIPRFTEEPPRPIPRFTEEPPRPIPRFAEEPPRYLPRFAEEPPRYLPRFAEEPPRYLPRFAEEPPQPIPLVSANSTNFNVTCADHRKRLEESPVAGQLIPVCREDGKYASLQCHDETADGNRLCECWDPEGNVVRAPSTKTQTCGCFLEYKRLINTIGARKGAYVPQCEENGYYKYYQCAAKINYCWCADPISGEETGGRKFWPYFDKKNCL